MFTSSKWWNSTIEVLLSIGKKALLLIDKESLTVPCYRRANLCNTKLSHNVRSRCKYNEWEDWLFPVIQATWEARTAGWLEKESFFHQTKAIRIKAPLAMGRSAEEASLHGANFANNRSRSSKSHAGSRISRQTQFSIIYLCQMC